jgi:phosphoribosylaminoimidazolecarboxamide formyltransferase/IMP cyclohydrolase
MELKKISRALISVSDKTNLADMLQILKEFDVEIVSTGGTYKAIRDLGYKCIEISNYTGFPELMDGRVKTLHPKIHGGLLGDVDKKSHRNSMQNNNIPEINLVIVNLYPFEEKLLDKKSTKEILIENIDIGGPSMLRSSAKNFKHVTVLPSTKYYEEFITIMKKNNGSIDLNFRTRMANETFNETAYYDSMISNWMNQINENKFSEKKVVGGKLAAKLRYGENPHQESAVYEIPKREPGFSNLIQLQGKKLSHNNYLDSFSAYSLVTDFRPQDQICAIIKHNNPCGCAIDPDGKLAYLKALSGDPISAFGGVVAFNYEITKKIAEELVKTFYH